VSEKHTEMRARRVVAGLDTAGRSTIASDGETPSRLETPGFTINQIWQVGALPTPVLAEDGSEGVSIAPPRTGFVYLLATFPPDASWDAAAGYKDALTAAGDGGSHVEDEAIAGLHETDTVDLVTILSGEIYAVLETGEVLLKAGDSFVQRGTKHTWSNRSDRPCTLVAAMAGARR